MRSLEDTHQFMVVSAYVSEGENSAVIDEIARSVTKNPGVTLIEVDPNRHYNRSDIIFGGMPEAVYDASLSFALTAYNKIDLRNQPNPPLGALELLSFIPLHSGNLAKAVKLSKTFSKAIAKHLNLPVYLFGAATSAPQRQHIRDFRQFDNKHLPDMLKNPDWKPDFGPPEFDEKAGIMIIGARLYHINFAMYFDTEDVELIDELTKVYRRLPDGAEEQVEEADRAQAGNFGRISEILKQINTFVDDFPEEKVVRLLCNVPDYVRTPFHTVIEEFKKEAVKLGIKILGNKVLGYLPAEVLICAGREILGDEAGQYEKKELGLIAQVVSRLQLDPIEPFEIKRQVLDYLID